MLRKHLLPGTVVEPKLTVEGIVISQIKDQNILYWIGKGRKGECLWIIYRYRAKLQGTAIGITAQIIAYGKAHFINTRAGVGMIRMPICTHAAITEGPGPGVGFIKAQVLEVKSERIFRVSVDAVVSSGQVVDTKRITRAAVDGAEAVVGVVGEGEGVVIRKVDVVLYKITSKSCFIWLVDDVQYFYPGGAIEVYLPVRS